MISPKVSVINSFYTLVQERKYLMKSTTSKHIDKGEILKLCTEKFSALGLDDEVRGEKEQTEISFLRKDVENVASVMWKKKLMQDTAILNYILVNNVSDPRRSKLAQFL